MSKAEMRPFSESSLGVALRTASRMLQLAYRLMDGLMTSYTTPLLQQSSRDSPSCGPG